MTKLLGIFAAFEFSALMWAALASPRWPVAALIVSLVALFGALLFAVLELVVMEPARQRVVYRDRRIIQAVAHRSLVRAAGADRPFSPEEALAHIRAEVFPRVARIQRRQRVRAFLRSLAPKALWARVQGAR
jgi:hypothetical protein